MKRPELELLAWGLEDFNRFCGLLEIVPKSGPRVRLRLNDIQRKYCRSRTARDVVLKPRQIGFTTLEQARDIFHFLTVPGARVVTTCQSITDHGPLRLLSKNYSVMFDALSRLGLGLKFRTDTASEWTLADRDASLRIVEAGASEAAASKKGRAGTISRLHLTETAFYEYAGETLNALLECVPGIEHGSEVVSESTPNGASGVFYTQCQQASAGQSGFKLHFFPWFDAAEYALALEPGETLTPTTEREKALVSVHGINPAQLKWYRRKLSEKSGDQSKMDQEYPSDPDTCFLVTGRCFFDIGILNALAQTARPPLSVSEKGQLSIWKRPEPGAMYVIGADTSEGVGGDYSSAIVYRRGTGEHVATLRGQFPAWDFARALSQLGTIYNTATIAVERNNHGHAVLQGLEREQKYKSLFRGHDDRPGWVTSSASRPLMLDELDDAIRRRVWASPDVQVLKEMRVFVVNATGRAEAAKGEHDDLVIASAIGWAVMARPQVKRSLHNLPPA